MLKACKIKHANRTNKPVTQPNWFRMPYSVILSGKCAWHCNKLKSVPRGFLTSHRDKQSLYMCLFTVSEILKSFDIVDLQSGRLLTATSLQIRPGVHSGIILIIRTLVMSLPCPSVQYCSVRWIVGN